MTDFSSISDFGKKLDDCVDIHFPTMISTGTVADDLYSAIVTVEAQTVNSGLADSIEKIIMCLIDVIPKEALSSALYQHIMNKGNNKIIIAEEV